VTLSEKNSSEWRSNSRETAAVWIIVPHPIVRAGIRSQLSGSGFIVSAEAGSLDAKPAGEAQRELPLDTAVPRDLPVIAIIDASFGTSAVAQLKRDMPHLLVVVFAENAELGLLASSFEAGADGYVLKSISSAALLDSLRLVLHGEKVFPGIVTDFLSTLRSTQTERPGRAGKVGDVWLTDREIEILRGLALGHTNKRIANSLNLTEATVKVNLKSVLRKLGLTNRTQVAIWAVQHNVPGLSEALASETRPDVPLTGRNS
jgi:two-component system nitrate/nitrite response regulator NarL